MKMSSLTKEKQKQVEEEELRRLERNRVAFEGWLQRKREERKKQSEMDHAAQRELSESRMEQREIGRLAFQRWLKTKQYEDAVRKKEKVYLNEVDKLRNENKAEEKRRAKEKFEMWRTQKDYETRLQRKNDRELSVMRVSPVRESTPSLPGYVSVWSCDNELVDFMVDKVDRGPHQLSDTSDSYTLHIGTGH